MSTEYNLNKWCRVCGAKPNDPCVMHTDEFDDTPLGALLAEPHYFGGRRVLGREDAKKMLKEAMNLPTPEFRWMAKQMFYEAGLTVWDVAD